MSYTKVHTIQIIFTAWLLLETRLQMLKPTTGGLRCNIKHESPEISLIYHHVLDFGI
jgi:hypothetical protein